MLIGIASPYMLGFLDVYTPSATASQLSHTTRLCTRMKTGQAAKEYLCGGQPCRPAPAFRRMKLRARAARRLA